MNGKIQSKSLNLDVSLFYNPQCTASHNYNLTSTIECYNQTTQGSDLQRAHGDQTQTIDLSFVPSVEFDNVSFMTVIKGFLLTFFIVDLFQPEQLGTNTQSGSGFLQTV